jgi:hypothetical protein
MREFYVVSQDLVSAVNRLIGDRPRPMPTDKDCGQEWATLPAGSKMFVTNHEDELVLKHIPHTGNQTDINAFHRDAKKLKLLIKNQQA